MTTKKKPTRKPTPAAPTPKKATAQQKEAAAASKRIRSEKHIDSELLLAVLSELTLEPRALGKEDYDDALIDVAVRIHDKLQEAKAAKDKLVDDDQQNAGSFTMASVKSSNVASIGYDKKSKTMRVLFNNGTAYRYADVAPALHKSIVESKSIGRDIRQVYDHKTTKE